MRLTAAELKALRSALRHGETPLEFIASAINFEIARREGMPRRGSKAVQVLRLSQEQNSGDLREVEITLRCQRAA
jgi:hypothetical protein